METKKLKVKTTYLPKKERKTDLAKKDFKTHKREPDKTSSNFTLLICSMWF